MGAPVPWREVAFFAGLPDQDVQQVLSVARPRRFARGEVLFHLDDRADAVYLIARGRVAVRVVTYEGQTATLAIRGPGEIVGELALLADESSRTATAVAIEPTETLRLARADFATLREAHPSVAEVLIRILANRLMDTSRLLVEALVAPAPVRVRNRLADLAHLYGAEGQPAIVELSQEDLASIAGTTRAMVNRVLQEERAAGRVDLTRGKIVIRCDPETIRESAS